MQSDSSTRKIWLGRAREMGELEVAIDDLMAGRGSVFLFAGEPGIGKTRLADELGSAAARRGASVHWGRTWESGGAPSYWPFVQILRSVAREQPDIEALDLATLIPEFGARGSGEPGTTNDSLRDRFQLFNAISAFLHTAAAKTPLVVVLDDLHTADPSSLLLLTFLVRDRRASPLLFVGTYRDAEARLSKETSALLAQVAREANVLPLRRLDRAEVAEYLAVAANEPPTADRVDAIHRQTEGNPLFLRELLRLETNAGQRQSEGIREVVRARLALLSPAIRHVLEMASVLGREFKVEALARLVETKAATDLPLLLVPAVDASIIERLESSASHYRFTHVLLREGLYSELPPERRAELHAAAASSSSSSGGLAERAHHLLHAIPAVSVGEAADAALRAAERAMDLLAFEHASDLLTRAATLLEGCVEGEEERLFEVWLGLGLARIRGADVENGKLLCLRAGELARKLGNGNLFARAVLGCAYEFAPGVRNTQLIGLLEDALAMLPLGDGALRARCMSQLAAERQPEPDTRGPMDLAREAVAMARRLGGDKDTLRFTLTTAGLALMAYAEPEERIALDQETLRLAQGAHDKRVALRAHLLLMNNYLDQGALDRAGVHTRSYEALAHEFSHGAFHWTMVAVRGGQALSEGRFEEAERAFRDARELAQKDATRGTSLAALPVGFASVTERYEDVAEIELLTREAFCSVSHDLGSCIAELLIARLHGRLRAREQAARQLAVVRAHPVFAQIKEPTWLALLAEACHLLHDVPMATHLYAALEAHAPRFSNLGHLGLWGEPPYSRQLGLVAQTLGRFDDAVRHLTDAESRSAAAGMHAHLARLRLELAEALLNRASKGDHARARELLENAQSIARELNQSALLRMIDERLVEVSGAPPREREAEPTKTPQRASTIESLVLLREGDYWTVSFNGTTMRLRDSRGLRVLDRLLANPDQEFHVLQLASSEDDHEAGGAASAGDAGAVLDSEAIQSYRKRLLELREELEEAEQFSDKGRMDRAKTEIDFLTQELARAVGLGGRERRVGNAAERARTTVQKRLREAIRRIEDALPEISPHLGNAIRTGTFCGYFPQGRRRG